MRRSRNALPSLLFPGPHPGPSRQRDASDTYADGRRTSSTLDSMQILALENLFASGHRQAIRENQPYRRETSPVPAHPKACQTAPESKQEVPDLI